MTNNNTTARGGQHFSTRHFRVPTSVGDVWVTPLRAGQVKVASVTGDHSVDVHEGGAADRLYVTLNKIQYDVDAWLTRQPNGAWLADHDFWLRREDYYRAGHGKGRNPSDHAVKRISFVIYNEVGAWLETDAAEPLREVMRRAERSDALHVLSQLQREVRELEIELERRRESLAAAEKRYAVAAGDAAV